MGVGFLSYAILATRCRQAIPLCPAFLFPSSSSQLHTARAGLESGAYGQWLPHASTGGVMRQSQDSPGRAHWALGNSAGA